MAVPSVLLHHALHSPPRHHLCRGGGIPARRSRKPGPTHTHTAPGPAILQAGPTLYICSCLWPGPSCI
ncbi:hypothetical protein FKM82_001866 [Ascaphus truei]